MSIKKNVLGFPRIGERRELKFATESYWKGEISQEELVRAGDKIKVDNWKALNKEGIDFIPSNDFSYYDQVLDTSLLLGNIPERFDSRKNELDLLFDMARGQASNKQSDFYQACEMTKWFNTNYHYIVPEFTKKTSFSIYANKIFDEIKLATTHDIKVKPVIIGPLTYLYLGKSKDTDASFSKWDLLDSLLPVYQEILSKLHDLNVEWVQVDEPILGLDLAPDLLKSFQSSYQKILGQKKRPKVSLTSYFSPLQENISVFEHIRPENIHLDLINAKDDLDGFLQSLQDEQSLSLGLVNGRNIWLNNYQDSVRLIDKALTALGQDRLWVSTSCSLIHVPLSLYNERFIEGRIKEQLSFAYEKLKELDDIANIVAENRLHLLEDNRSKIIRRENDQWVHKKHVQTRIKDLKEQDFNRSEAFSHRSKSQQQKYQLPVLPTTTIGSFPQTKEIRTARTQFKKGEITEEKYNQIVAELTRACIKTQEEIGLDVLVHGEYERNDMVEYFGEHLNGFIFTKLAWVQSYGSRYVKPPIIYGDIERKEPITVKWSSYAQSLTDLPVKGMLTGPVTILHWSFPREDVTKEESATQIALAIRDEVCDLERAGIGIIQVDEPALREGLPLRTSEQKSYLTWAIKTFRLSTSGIKSETQIHTHMCYSEFNNIIKEISELDADVITIEASRSEMELLDAFKDFHYPNEIGPGIYDVHSPEVPQKESIKSAIARIVSKIPIEQVWINPDCGLKTRAWEEVIPSLKNLVVATKEFREAQTK